MYINRKHTMIGNDILYSHLGDIPWNMDDGDVGYFIEQNPFLIGSNILDVGCGTGNLLFYFKKVQSFKEYLGIDTSHVAIEICKEKFKGQKKNIFLCQNILELNKYPKEIYTNIFDIGCLHMLPNTAHKDILLIYKKILKIGGVFYIRCFNNFGKTPIFYHKGIPIYGVDINMLKSFFSIGWEVLYEFCDDTSFEMCNRYTFVVKKIM